MGSLPQGFGVKIKIFELPPPSYCFRKELFHQQFQATIRFMVFDFQQNWVVEKCLGEFVLLKLGKNFQSSQQGKFMKIRVTDSPDTV